jgi:tRNA(Ile)-lysidine synthase
MAKAWADVHGRPLLALTVDHGLRPESAIWTRFCQERAAALGVEHRILPWLGDKPLSGLPAAARAARHRLLADAARAGGAAVILMGHTADDRAEAAVMRRSGSTTPSPKAWAPSPVWPEGRGLFLLRPLLAVRRGDLRSALASLGETWIDDPGNVDPRSPRALARAEIAGGPLPDEPWPDEPRDVIPPQVGEIGDITFGAGGDLFTPAEALTGSLGGPARLGALLLCASGAERPPRREALERLMARLAAGKPFAATLAGCKVTFDGAEAHFVREIGDARGSAARDLVLAGGETAVWDGRFEVAIRGDGASVGPLAGRARALDRDLRQALARLRPATRRALPLVTHADGVRTLPTLRPDPLAAVRPLARARLAATLETIVDERALRRMAKRSLPY